MSYKNDLGEEFFVEERVKTYEKDYFMSVKKSNVINKLCDIFESLESIQDKIHKKQILSNLDFPELEEKIQDLEIAIRDYEAYNREHD
ncbi:MAG: hypothetical protein HC875_33600 [Anaerolineales bacterium]|nr:hypothetical protein [Anaerolineales bacterium]